MSGRDQALNHGVVLDRDSLDRGDLDWSKLKACLSDWQIHPHTDPGDTAARIAQAEVVVSNKVVLDAGILRQAKNLKLVCIAATGTNNIDLDAARELGIAVSNVRAYATPSVVQHVFALILSLSRHLPDYQRAIAEGRWQRAREFCLLDFPIEEIEDKTLGIVGFGELGRAVAQAARAFGLKVIIAQRPGTSTDTGEHRDDRVPLNELLEQADIVSLHVPLSENTRGLIGATQLARMKSSAILINTARGHIVDEQALADALRRRELAGAGVDVLAEEPPRHGGPLLEKDIPNLIVTPHIAWASRASRQRLLDQVADNVRSFIAGEARNRVD